MPMYHEAHYKTRKCGAATAQQIAVLKSMIRKSERSKHGCSFKYDGYQ